MRRRLILWLTWASLLAGLVPLARAEVFSTPAGAIYYEIRGEGCPLVLVGGGSAMGSRQWDAARDLLAERFQTVAVDPRGIGRSENPTAGYSDVDDLAALLDHLEIPAALFAGGSWAGAKVLEMALAHPDRVIGGVAVAPFLPGFEPSPEMTRRIERFNEAAQEGADAFLAVARDDPHFLPAPARPEARELAWRLIGETFARPAAADPSLARRPVPPVRERLGDFVSPVLLVSGALDHPDVSRRLDILQKGIPGAQRVTVPKAGHTAAMENPEAFVQAVLPFLHGLGCRVWSPAKARARAELLQLHRDVLRFHREHDVESWLEREAPVQIVAGRGEVSFPTTDQRHAQREDYLDRTEFTVYRDRRPPVVRVADDLSQGWLMAEVEVEGTQESEQGTTPFRWVGAWIELFERGEDGAWRWVGNVSNARP